MPSPLGATPPSIVVVVCMVIPVPPAAEAFESALGRSVPHARDRAAHNSPGSRGSSRWEWQLTGKVHDRRHMALRSREVRGTIYTRVVITEETSRTLAFPLMKEEDIRGCSADGMI